MNLEDKMREYKEQTKISGDEQKILDTIRKSQDTFYKKEEEKLLTYWEFLWTQLRMIQKKWWLFQALLLALAGAALPSLQEEYFLRRSMGVTGALFIILVIPELWKNKTCQCLEIEGASFYSLRQIYAARILLFGIVDIFLLTIFCGILHGSLNFTFRELLIQFLFPMAVTACICFGMLYNKRTGNEKVSIVFCILWSAVWWLITINEEIYTAVVFPVWLAFFGVAVLFLAVMIYRLVHDGRKY